MGCVHKNVLKDLKMIEPENLQLKLLDKAGLNTLIAWAKAEGWNPGVQESDVFWATDPQGFYGFFHQDELIAGGAVVSYDKAFGFMGLFIVHPTYRGQGIGRKLWHLRRDLLLSRLNPDASIGMDGVVAMQPFYEKGGFKISFRDERYECMGKAMSYSVNVLPITSKDYDQIAPYDTLCFGYARPNFLKNWLVMPQSQAFQYVDEGEIKGYAVIRKVDKGFKIGPLFANDANIAEELYKACLDSAVENPVYLDIPTVNEAALDLVQKFEATYIFECARMYYGTPPKVNLNRIFGITTFELG